MASPSKASTPKAETGTPISSCGSKPSSEPNTSEMMEGSISDLKRKARLNLVSFRHTLLQNSSDEVDPAEYHYDWSRSVLCGTGHEVWEAYRESAKSQYMLRAFPLYQLTFPEPRFDYIIIIKNNATLAANKLKEISEEYLSNKILSSNLVRILAQSGDVFHVETKDTEGNIVETRIEAYGKGASVRGAAYKDKRPKICLIDDPQDIEDAKSDIVLENDWTWFLSDVIFLGQKTRIFLIGNNLGDKCIVERVMTKAETMGFERHRIPVEIDGKPTWSAKFKMEDILKEKATFQVNGKLAIWLRERMCQSTSEETRIFNMADFPRFSHAEIPTIARFAKVWATLDPAASTTTSACFRAICVNAVTPENYWMIIDMPFGRWDSTVLVNKIFETVARWNLKAFGIEKGMLLDVLEPFLRQKMVKDQVFFELIPLEHAKKGTKLERIKMLQPRTKAKSIWLPDFAPAIDGLPSWITELEMELTGVTKDEIKSEYIDLVDALAMQDQIAKPPSLHGNQNAARSLPSLPRSYSDTTFL